MKTQESINILRRLNMWRRGADIPQPDPKEVTEAIAFAIRKLEKIKS